MYQRVLGVALNIVDMPVRPICSRTRGRFLWSGQSQSPRCYLSREHIDFYRRQNVRWPHGHIDNYNTEGLTSHTDKPNII